MSFVVYQKLSFEKNFSRVEISDEQYFSCDRISVDNLENYLELNFYHTPVEVISKPMLEGDFILNNSTVVLKMNDKQVKRVMSCQHEQKSIELEVEIAKSKNSIKVKKLLKLIRQQLNISDRIYISTYKQQMYQLEDYISITDHIFISINKPNSPVKRPIIIQSDITPTDQMFSEDLFSEASTEDSSSEEINQRNSFFDSLIKPNMCQPSYPQQVLQSTTITPQCLINQNDNTNTKVNFLSVPQSPFNGFNSNITNQISNNPFLKRVNAFTNSSATVSRQNRVNHIKNNNFIQQKLFVPMPLKKSIKK